MVDMSPQRKAFEAQAGADVAWYLHNFTPKPTLVSPESWLAIRDVVIEAVIEAVPMNSPEAKYMVSPGSQYVDWHHQRGTDLNDPTVLWAPSQIERWIDTRKDDLRQGTRSDYRLALRRIGAAVNPDFGVDRGRSIPRDEIQEPYKPTELVALHNWARHQPEGPRRNNAALLLALCLGAGLLTKDLRAVRGRDVEISDRGVLLHVPGSRPRTVPVLIEHERLVADAARERVDDYLFYPTSSVRGTNMVTAYIGSCVKSDAPRVAVNRLRINWIVWHLDHGTPVAALTEAAGSTLNGLSVYARYCAPVEPGRAIASLRGATS